MKITERHTTGWKLVKTVVPSATHDALVGAAKTLVYELIAAAGLTYAVGFIFADKLVKKETEEK